ncbi:hypothetical protein CTAYLR_003999 [Chrysophaeum taylorii]|uniref:Uncharacterized protein n=1 Tax=Chrysophaeum taylorii TaxID=2483200 RepID=A0AAD7U7N9_9STRA|nr:hypothetical protein CTAYLR_003999 [Chrysophaeum taylorii]
MDDGGAGSAIDVILLTDRIAPSSAVLASACVNTKARRLRFHVVVPDSALDEARAQLMPAQCAGAEWRLLAESAVVQSIRDFGLALTWEIEVPRTNSSVRVPRWDRSSKHNSVFNCLRFYLPRLPEFAELESLIFMDDDIIIQGDLAKLWEFPLDKPLTAGCLNWIWNSCARMEAFLDLSYVEVPYMGFGMLPRGGEGSVASLTCASDDQRECAPAGFFESLAETSEKIQGCRLDIDGLRSKRAWNFGLNKFNLSAWRAANLTERYIAWIVANKEFGWFPTTSLGYGLGIAYLTLADDVICTDDDDVGMSVLHGLGFVEPDDLILGGIPLGTIRDFYALHWNGDRKPYSPTNAIPEYADYFLVHAPTIKKGYDKARRRTLATAIKSRSFVVWTEPRSGSEWFMNVIDKHSNVCASGEVHSSGRGWPRESLLPSQFLGDNVEVCQPKAVCYWAIASRLLETLLIRAGNDTKIPSVCESRPKKLRSERYGDDHYKTHLGSLCAILGQAVPAASADDRTEDSWRARVMRESFRIFVTRALGGGGGGRSDALQQKNASGWRDRKLFFGGGLPEEPRRMMPCACPPNTTTTGTKIMNDWLDIAASSASRDVSPSKKKKKYDFYFFTSILEELGSKIVVLDRENLFAAYVSLRVAEFTRSFHCRGSSCRHEGRVRVDVDQLLGFVRHNLRQREKRDLLLANKRSFEVLRIQYEFCVENKPACFRKVLGFLDVDDDDRALDGLLAGSSDVTSRDVRTAVERVLNFDEVARALVEAGMERYLRTPDEINTKSNAGSGSAPDDVHVLVMSDRAPALATTLSSLCSAATTTSIATLVVHLVVPSKSTDPSLWDVSAAVEACDGARFKVRSIDSVQQELLERHDLRPVWMSWLDASTNHHRDAPPPPPRYARDRSDKHSSPFNLARFYVPLLREYEDVPRLILLDDDVVVQGAIGAANKAAEDEKNAVVLAGCQNWISTQIEEEEMRMSPNYALKVFDTPHFGFRRIRPGGNLSDALCEDDAEFDCMPSTFLDTLAAAWKDVRCETTTIGCREDGPEQQQQQQQQHDAIIRGIAAQPAWNFGLAAINIPSWRRKNLTFAYHAWTRIAASRGIFPAGSLAHGLGLAYLALEDQVKCWESLVTDEQNIDVLQGLGYVQPRDLAAGNLSIPEAFALHFNGEVKPWDARSPYRGVWEQRAPLDVVIKLPEQAELRILEEEAYAPSGLRMLEEEPYTNFAPTTPNPE